MLENNKNISDYLYEYVGNSNPQYAIMLIGKWGSGKSFFIKKWISEYKNKQKNNQDSNKLTWTPIYVSLYGLTSIQQVTEEINKEISPWLYTKGAEITKKILKIASKIVFKYDFDTNSDDKNDGNISCSLDALGILKSDNVDIEGDKILIFDDFERSQIKLETLLGYLNFFTEHCKCKVIVIGDKTKIVDEKDEKKASVFKEFEEKTIGRTFQIQSNIDEAVSFFIKKISANSLNRLDENKELVVKFFNASKCDNLRVLKQCLNDYSKIVDRFPPEYRQSNEYQQFIKKILSHFIVIYCEYKVGGVDIKKCFDSFTFYSGMLGKEEKAQYEKINSKYFSLMIENSIGFDQSLINIITYYLNNGVIDVSLFNSYLCDKPKRAKEDWEYFLNIYSLNNDSFQKHYKNMVSKFKRQEYTNMGSVVGTAGILCYLIDNNLSKLKKETVISICRKNIKKLIGLANNADSLYSLQASFSAGSQSLRGNTDLNVIWPEFYTQITKKREKIDNPITSFIENINDENINSLNPKLSETAMDRQRPNSLTPIFKKVNANKLANSIIALSNNSKREFCDILSIRYGIIHDCFKEDFPTLEKTSNLLRKKTKKMTLLDLHITNEVIKTFDDIVSVLK